MRRMITHRLMAVALIVAAITVLGSSAGASQTQGCGNGQGQPLLLGCSNQATATTRIDAATGDVTGFLVTHTSHSNAVAIFGSGGRRGVHGFGGSTGVYADGGSWGVYATGGSYGIEAEGGTYGVFTRSEDTGVRADADLGFHANGRSYGVYANGFQGTGVYANGSTTGIRGHSESGTGIVADSNTGTALRVDGPAEFSRSGTLTIPAGASLVTKADIALTPRSLVFAILQQNRPDVWVRAATPNVAGSSFVIRLCAGTPGHHGRMVRPRVAAAPS